MHRSRTPRRGVPTSQLQIRALILNESYYFERVCSRPQADWENKRLVSEYAQGHSGCAGVCGARRRRQPNYLIISGRMF